jgi:hypothetical protein
VFRARVAEAADEAELGRASWLWLHRPVDWLDDPAVSGAAAGVPPTADDSRAAGGSRRDDKATAGRLRKAVADADAARRRTAEQLADLRRTETEVRSDRDRLLATLGQLQEERNAAVRRSKEIEAQLATARRDLKVARQATTDAEIELARLRTAPDGARRAPLPAAPVPPASSGPVRAEPAVAAPPAVDAAPSVHDDLDRAEVAASVAAAAAAAADLANALAQAAGALAPPAPPAPAAAPPEAAASAPPATGKADKKRPKKKARKGTTRTQPALPPGVFGATPDAHRALLGDPANLLVVDGYNVARAAWSGLAPEEERRRTVALLDDVQARSGGRVVVVFDGDDAVTAPKASKNVRVRFSATGQTADDAIVDLLSATPDKTPVVVVSSDRAVAADARRQGAVAVGARAFLTAAGR